MKQNKSSKKLVAKILLFTICFSLFLSVSPLQAPNAQAWLSIPAAIIGEGIATIRELILGIIMGAAKKAAVEMIMEEVGNMIGDSSESGEKYIQDWEDYIKTKPEEATKKYMNDYLSKLTQGRGSSRYSNIDANVDMGYANRYEGFGGINEYQFALIQSARAQQSSGGGGSGESYISSLAKLGKSIIEDDEKDKNGQRLYSKDPGAMFDEQNFGNLSSYFASGSDPWSFAYRVQQEKIKALALEKEKQTLKALSSGYLPATRNGKVTTPSDTIAAIQNKAATISMDVTANATTITEVIVSAVTSLVGQLVDEGIGQGKEQNQREDANTEQRDDNNTQNNVQESGPQAEFKST